MRRFPGLLLLPFVVAFLVGAQPSHSQQQAPAAVPAREAAGDDLAANPARPTVANPATLTPPGYIQFEQGVQEATRTPGGPDRQFSVVQVTKLAFNSRVMAIFGSQPFAHSTQDGEGSNDPGDLDLGVQVVVFDASKTHGPLPTLALSYLQRVRSGTSANLDVGGFSRSALLLASGELPLKIHYDTNFLFNEQPGTGYTSAATPAGGSMPPAVLEHDVNRAQFAETLSANRDLTEKFSISGEIWRFSQPFESGNAIGNLWALGYTPRKTLVFDAGFSKGLTGTSTRWEIFAGYTYLLPHRLWPARQR